MRERTSLTRGAMIPLGDTRTPPQDHPHSFFITITISQHKIRIKIPKFLTKITQKQFHGYKRTKPKRFPIRRKVFSIFTNVLGNNKFSVRGMRAKGFSKNAKKVGVGYIESKAKTEHSNNIRDHRGKGVSAANNNVSRGTMVIGKWESSGKLIKVSSKTPLTGGKWRGMKSLRNMGGKVFGKAPTREREGLELCKRRILMGSKCKPLNISVTL